MSDIGKFGWIDLTVPDATAVTEFYKQVADWDSSAVPVGDYEDYCVMPKGSKEAIAGICHQRGDNKDVPSQWLLYINVADVKAASEKCEALGGKIVCPIRDMGDYGSMAIIKDPAGAVCALFQAKS